MRSRQRLVIHGSIEFRSLLRSVTWQGARRRERSLIELSAFLISEQSVADTLTRVAHLAVEAVPPAMFAGITMMVDDRVDTQAFTDPTSPEIDQAQYESGHGPCLEAFRHGAVIVAESLESDDRWPEFAAAAIAHGVRSMLSDSVAISGVP